MEKTSRLIAIDIECGECKTLNSLTGAGYEFYSNSGQCDTCGSHGEVVLIVNADCRGCHKSIDNIGVSTW